MKGDAIATLQRELGDNWKVINEHHLEKEYSFKDFQGALDFTNRVGNCGKRRPSPRHLSRLRQGEAGPLDTLHRRLSENDFILAANADAVR